MIDLQPPLEARQRYYQAGHWQDKSLVQLIAASVAAHPDKTAMPAGSASATARWTTKPRGWPLFGVLVA